MESKDPNHYAMMSFSSILIAKNIIIVGVPFIFLFNECFFDTVWKKMKIDIVVDIL